MDALQLHFRDTAHAAILPTSGGIPCLARSAGLAELADTLRVCIAVLPLDRPAAFCSRCAVKVAL